jgi:hypothetical protein
MHRSRSASLSFRILRGLTAALLTSDGNIADYTSHHASIGVSQSTHHWLTVIHNFSRDVVPCCQNLRHHLRALNSTPLLRGVQGPTTWKLRPGRCLTTLHSLLVSLPNYRNERRNSCRHGRCQRPTKVSRDSTPSHPFPKRGVLCRQLLKNAKSRITILHGTIYTTKSPSSGPHTGLKV